MVTDGAASIGELDADLLRARTLEAGKAGKVVLHTVASGHAPDEDFLATLTRPLGGHTLRMLPDEDPAATAEAVLHRVRVPLVTDVVAEVIEGQAVGLAPARLENAVARRPLAVFGRLRSDTAKIRFSGKVLGKRVEEVVDVGGKGSADGRLLGRFWAREQLRVMEEAKTGRDEVVSLSLRYGVMSRYTSFLVLENEEAYRRFAVDRKKEAERVEAEQTSEAVKNLEKSEESLTDVLRKTAPAQASPPSAPMPEPAPRASAGAPGGAPPADAPAEESKRESAESFAPAPPEADDDMAAKDQEIFEEDAPARRAGSVAKAKKSAPVKMSRAEPPRLSVEEARRQAKIELAQLSDARMLDVANRDLILREASLHETLGDPTRALRTLSEMVEFNPHDFAARQAYARALKERGSVNAACAELATAVQLNPAERDTFREMMSFAREDPKRVPDVRSCIVDGVSKLPVRRAISLVLTWESDDGDVDLHVHEAGGHHVFYSSRESPSGGLLYYDITDGLGPEIYVLGSEVRGTFDVGLVYYGGTRRNLKATLTLLRNAGSPEETRETKTVVLKAPDTEREVRVFRFKQ